MGNKVLVLSSEGVGKGDEALGKILMPSFLRVLGQSPDKPKTIICWNTGVSLMTEDSPSLAELKWLEEEGVEILACRTCVDRLGLADKLAVGKASAMEHFVDLLLHNDALCV